ncbi:MAG TPA: hypothetical protein VFR58_17975 [Flavisolibacter sp.]|nr:hypothetical protein [Flavisolibacter sp.]
MRYCFVSPHPTFPLLTPKSLSIHASAVIEEYLSFFGTEGNIRELSGLTADRLKIAAMVEQEGQLFFF